MSVSLTQVSPADMTRLLEGLASDCPPTQFIREFVFNAIQAIQRAMKAGILASGEGEIIVDFDPVFFKKSGRYKLCITDNGISFPNTAASVSLIKDLSKSGDPNLALNHGMGGKISAAMKNKLGIHYYCFPKGCSEGFLMSFVKETEGYGAKEYHLGGGSYSNRYPLPLSSAPDLVKKSGQGTKVLFHGNSDAEDTMAPPPGLLSGLGGVNGWLLNKVQSHFYEIPRDISIRVRYGYSDHVLASSTSYLAECKSQKDIYLKDAISHGQVELDIGIPDHEAVLDWYILDKDRSLTDKSRRYCLGNTSLVLEGEVYEKYDRNGNLAQKMFGIYFGQTNVALILRPKNDHAWRPNRQRTGINTPNGFPVPWDRYGRAFRKNMPKELVDYIASESQKGATDLGDKMRKRLDQVKEFFKVSKYVSSSAGATSIYPNPVEGEFGSGGAPDGKYRNDPAGTAAGPEGFTPAPGPNPGPGPGTDPNPDRPAKGLLPDPEGDTVAQETGTEEKRKVHNEKPKDDTAPPVTKGTKSESTPFPEVSWVSLARGNRTEEELEDQAAEYNEEAHIIKINEDFSGYTDLVKYFLDEMPGAAEVIPDSIKEWYEQPLIEAVTAALALRNRKSWSGRVANAWTPEALTAVAGQRFHLMQSIRKEIPNRFAEKEKQDLVK